MRVWVIADGRVPPAWEPAGDPVPGGAGYRSGSRGWEFVRRRRAGRTALTSRGPRQARPASRSWARSAIRQDRDAPAARATVLSSRTADSSGAARRQAIRRGQTP